MNTPAGIKPHGRKFAAIFMVCAFTWLAQADVARPAGSHDNDAPCSSVAAAKPGHVTRSVGKGSTPVKFVSPARFKGRNGEVLTVSLVVRATEDIAQMTAQATTEKALVFVNSRADSSFAGIPAGEDVTLSYVVQPQAEGLSYVNVIVTTHSDRGKRMVSYSIPVEVGDIRGAAAAKRVPDVILDEDGVMLQVMPAREGEPAARPK